MQRGKCGTHCPLSSPHHPLQGSSVPEGAVTVPDRYGSSQYTLYSSRVEGNQDPLGDLESVELSKVVKALSCLFHHSVRVYSP